MNKSQRMRQTGHTTHMKHTELTYKIAVGLHYEQTPLELRRPMKVDIINL
jgi:hypothetical protein